MTRSEDWAHQDSNLERTGYEPVALTIELWARRTVYRMALLVSAHVRVDRWSSGEANAGAVKVPIRADTQRQWLERTEALDYSCRQ
jgi:hypothetical protein